MKIRIDYYVRQSKIFDLTEEDMNYIQKRIDNGLNEVGLYHVAKQSIITPARISEAQGIERYLIKNLEINKHDLEEVYKHFKTCCQIAAEDYFNEYCPKCGKKLINDEAI